MPRESPEPRRKKKASDDEITPASDQKDDDLSLEIAFAEALQLKDRPVCSLPRRRKYTYKTPFHVESDFRKFFF
jgi:hypothetical protein